MASKVKRDSQLKEAIRQAFDYDDKVIVEKGLDGCRELEVSVLGNERARLSQVGEIKPANEFYDYASKYEGLASELIIPAPLTTELQHQVSKLGASAYRVLDCRGFARVDFLLDAQTQTLYLNEVNTIPGFTNISMYPMLWEASGLGYVDLIDTLIKLALQPSYELTHPPTTSR